MVKKLMLLSAAVLFVGGIYGVSLRNQNVHVPSEKQVSADKEELCDMPEHQATAVAAQQVQVRQDPDDGDVPQQAPPADGDKRCERPDPKNPDVGGKDPKKIGCSCARKPPCDANNYPSENFDSEETRCKNHCRKDKCDCPNPCKS